MFIGIFSSMHQSDFCALYSRRQLCADDSQENIRSGDPMKVYKEMNQVDMFLSITFNNLRVSFCNDLREYFFGLGTLFIIYNSIMVGAFQYFSSNADYFRIVSAIWVHGALNFSHCDCPCPPAFQLGRDFYFGRIRADSRSTCWYAGGTGYRHPPIIALAAISEKLSDAMQRAQTPCVPLWSPSNSCSWSFISWYCMAKIDQRFNIRRRSDEIPWRQTGGI